MKKYITLMALLLFLGVCIRSVNCKFFSFRENPCNYCTTHIACNKEMVFDKKCFPNVEMLNMTDDMRNFLMDRQNYYRDFVAGGNVPGYKPAIRMAKLSWNYEFEYLSALNLLQCEMAHDKCRRTPRNRYVGQNLAFLKWRGYNFTLEEVLERLIRTWFLEYEYATMDDILKLPKRDDSLPLIGHFTLLVQERANEVGCSILRQKSNDNIEELYLACDYSFSNIYDVEVYRDGKKASACQTGVDDKYKNLCSSYEEYDTSTHIYQDV